MITFIISCLIVAALGTLIGVVWARVENRQWEAYERGLIREGFKAARIDGDDPDTCWVTTESHLKYKTVDDYLKERKK